MAHLLLKVGPGAGKWLMTMSVLVSFGILVYFYKMHCYLRLFYPLIYTHFVLFSSVLVIVIERLLSVRPGSTGLQCIWFCKLCALCLRR